ncbi:hypothetical protein [Vulgatibacter incomptus]|uniref:Uncharacterized protein n=1 Tax=Vulgatibacter incomptus TaxID=1391653 RepID=A0A0K1PCF4_9BACT|nr:hypothetical protein [Vulgatibacter incomptus]AKU91192.1 hypothetical protein AKJ08_1579 [Vulgatibacter incomptus]
MFAFGRKIVPLVALWACAFVWGACGRFGVVEEDPGPDSGTIRVVVQPAHAGPGPQPGDITGVFVILAPRGTIIGDNGEVVNNINIELERDPISGRWSASRDRVFVGTYALSAEAQSPQGVLFRSEPRDVSITKDAHSTVVIVMNQASQPGDIYAPVLGYLGFPTYVEQGDTAQIHVVANQGEGALTASGSFPAGAQFTGEFGNPVTVVNGEAILQWTAPRNNGPKPLIIRVSDQDGNRVEMGIVIQVGVDYAEALLEATFNLAPHVEIRGEVTHSAASSELAIRLRSVDTDSVGQMRYEWTSTCGGTFTQGAATGTFTTTTTGEIAEVRFTYEVVGAARLENCVLEATVTDPELAWASESYNVRMLPPGQGG